MEDYIVAILHKYFAYFNKLYISAHSLADQIGRHSQLLVAVENCLCSLCFDNTDDDYDDEQNILVTIHRIYALPVGPALPDSILIPQKICYYRSPKIVVMVWKIVYIVHLTHLY